MDKGGSGGGSMRHGAHYGPDVACGLPLALKGFDKSEVAGGEGYGMAPAPAAEMPRAGMARDASHDAMAVGYDPWHFFFNRQI